MAEEAGGVGAGLPFHRRQEVQLAEGLLERLHQALLHHLLLPGAELAGLEEVVGMSQAHVPRRETGPGLQEPEVPISREQDQALQQRPSQGQTQQSLQVRRAQRLALGHALFEGLLDPPGLGPQLGQGLLDGRVLPVAAHRGRHRLEGLALPAHLQLRGAGVRGQTQLGLIGPRVQVRPTGATSSPMRASMAHSRRTASA